jgi:hypothetical protein
MSKARNIADAFDANGDVAVSALDNVPPNTALVDSSDNTVLDTSTGDLVMAANASIRSGADLLVNRSDTNNEVRLGSGNASDSVVLYAGGGGVEKARLDPSGNFSITGDVEVGGQTFTKKPYMQVQTTGSRTYPDGWSNVYFDVNKFNYNCSHNSNYYFEFYKTGMYRITVSYRYGSGGDVWTANRMYNVATARELGISHGTGQTANDPATNHFEYFIEVQDADLYANAGNNVVMQWLRVGSSFTIADPYSTLPALVVTVEYFSDL